MTLKSVETKLEVPEYEDDKFIELSPEPNCKGKANEELFNDITKHFNENQTKKFLLNMSKVMTINSDFLAKIMELSLMLRPYQGRIAYWNPLPVVNEILTKTGTKYVFRVYDRQQRKEAELYLSMPIDTLRELSKQIGYDEESPTSLMEVSAKVIEKLANR